VRIAPSASNQKLDGTSVGAVQARSIPSHPSDLADGPLGPAPGHNRHPALGDPGAFRERVRSPSPPYLSRRSPVPTSRITSLSSSSSAGSQLRHACSFFRRFGLHSSGHTPSPPDSPPQAERVPRLEVSSHPGRPHPFDPHPVASTGSGLTCSRVSGADVAPPSGPSLAGGLTKLEVERDPEVRSTCTSVRAEDGVRSRCTHWEPDAVLRSLSARLAGRPDVTPTMAFTQAVSMAA
jgi:hypothetical protein